MAVELELRENIDLGHIAVETVADRDIYEPVVGTQRHGRLGPLLRQRVQPCPGATSEDDPKNTLQRQRDRINYDVMQNKNYVKTFQTIHGRVMINCSSRVMSQVLIN